MLRVRVFALQVDAFWYGVRVFALQCRDVDAFFSNKWSSFHGSTPDFDVVNEIIREYEIATVSKFRVWKVARNFGSTGMFSFILSFKVLYM